MKDEIKKTIKNIREEINFNIRQKMKYRDRIHNECLLVAKLEKKYFGIFEARDLENTIKRNNNLIKTYEENNDLLYAQLRLLEELMKNA